MGFRNLLPGILLLVAGISHAQQEESRAVFETEIDADVSAVWNAFTTAEGLKSWMAPKVEINLKIGGKMKSTYDANGTIGDPSTIENTILAFDPHHMLTLQATTFPEGFRFEKVAKGTWSVFYFEELPNSRTKLTVVGLGYTDDPLSQEMKSFFAAANKYSLDKLKAALAEKESELEKSSVDGSRAESE